MQKWSYLEKKCRISFENPFTRMISNLTLVYPSHVWDTSTEGGLPTTPSLDVCCKALTSYDFEDRFESLLSIDTKKVPVALHLMMF